MFKIDKKDYSRVKIFLDLVEINTLFARAVLDCEVDGEVYVDCKESPRCVYVRHNPFNMSLLYGNYTKKDFIKAVLKRIKSREYKGNEYLQFYPRKFKTVIDDFVDFENVEVKEYKRVNFEFDPGLFLRNSDSKKYTKVVEVDSNCFDKIEGRVVPKSFFNSKEDFLERGKGFAVIEDGVPASWAFSSFLGDNSLEIGIETHENHRKKDYAFHACSALIQYTIDRGLTPLWACEEENRGSCRLAKKLGFREKIDTPLIVFTG